MVDEHALWIRLGASIGVFALMAIWELYRPVRQLLASKTRRWLRNLGLIAFGSVLVRLVLPAGAVGAALLAEERNWGLLHIEALEGVHTTALSFALVVALSVVVLDLVVYAQHVAFHAIPILWRMHMVHHSDIDIDVTTGDRFHPLEILISMGLKIAIVILLGLPALAVFLFEVLLNGTSLFNHSNVRLPKGVDRVLRLIVVTPDMHRVHHSTRRRETDSNFGFNLPWWDLLFGTYRAQPEDGHQGMTVGLPHLRDARQQTFWWVLSAPFRPLATREHSSTDEGASPGTRSESG